MDFFFLNKTRKVLAWQKIQPSLGLHSRGTQNNKIKTHNKTHMNKKAHKAKYIQISGRRGRGEGREGILSESVS